MRVDAVSSVKVGSIQNFKGGSDKKKGVKQKERLESVYISNFRPVLVKKPLDLKDRRHFRTMKDNFSPEAETFYQQARALAKNAGARELELHHLYYVSLLWLKDFIKQCDENAVITREMTRSLIPEAIERAVPTMDGIFTNDEKRAKLAKVVDEHIKITREKYLKKDSKGPVSQGLSLPTVSKRTVEDMADAYEDLANRAKSNNYTDDYFLLTTMYSQDRTLAKEAVDFFTDVKKALIVEEVKRNADSLSFYDDKADTIWKNINLGNDAVFLYDMENREAKGHLVSSFVNMLYDGEHHYKNLEPDKTDIIYLNKHANYDFIRTMMKEARSDKSKEGRTTVIIADFFDALVNGGNTIELPDIDDFKNSSSSIKNKSKLRLVFSMPIEAYYANVDKNPYIKELFANYAVQTIPSLNARDAKKYLTDERGLKYVEETARKKFSKESIEKAIEITSNEEGNYPDKAVAFLSGAGKYFVDLKDITPNDLERYLIETRKLSETSNNNAQSDIVFDTGKRLSDIVGSPMTKADATSIVKQIQAGTIGTKGFRAFLEDGSSYGGGRRHTAEAIAGEAGIPMLTIDAKEFALKDIDALSQNANLSEMKIKKIVATAKAQAEANQNKSAMIFIENFDDFAPNPLYMSTSVYQSKAFSQLLSEMEKARKNDDVNLIVVGSVNTPQLIDPNIMKPYKFLNSIIVYPPQDADERREVFNYYINKMNLEIKDDAENKKEKIISDIAETTAGFTVVDIIYLLETVNAVSKERNKDKIDGSDFTEAFLQVISGRPNLAKTSIHDKRVVASHEAGHALTLQVLYEIAEKQDKPWRLPDKLNFITLDPRGSYGGAMFYKKSDNHEYSFEKVMSEIILSYGGHSAENAIYNMSGSLGITGDMQSASALARIAVLDMGMGPKTGVCHIPRNALGSPDVSEKKREAIEADIDSFTGCAKKISDMIVNEYKDFITQFTDKYADRVGTGECIIPSEEFVAELNAWRKSLPLEKQDGLKILEQNILFELDKAKKG